MKKFHTFIFRSSILLLLCLSSFTGIQAQNIYLVDITHAGITTAAPVTTVDATAWNNATGSLQAALNDAASIGGGQIWVKAGSYKPGGYPFGCSNCDNERDKAFLLQNNVAIYGGFAGTETLLSQRSVSANPTILSGDIGVVNVNSDNSYHILITVNSNSTAVLDGFTISDGNANGSGSINIMGQYSSRNSGGGILNDSFSSPTITNCTFTGGSAISNIYHCLPDITNCTFDGTGIVNDSFSHSTVTNCSFANNSNTGMHNYLSAPNVINCIFVNNSRGINNILSNPSIINCTFTNNSSGGISNGDFTQPVISNCTFTNGNMTNGSYSSPRVTNCRFKNNSSGMFNVRASPNVTNCSFANNSNGIFNTAVSSPKVTNCVFAGNMSNGIYNDFQCGPNITNCTFYNNGSYGIYYASAAYSNTKITNCVIWGNGANNAGTGIFYSPFGTNPPLVTYSIVQGSNPGTGNLNADPLYINAASPAGADGVFGTADDGLQLQLCSPSVNNGDNAAVPTSITSDITGATRIYGGRVDMGAYEHQGALSTLNLATNGNNATAVINGDTATHFIANCRLIASLISNGSNPVAGTVRASIWVDGVQSNSNGQAFVKRHYEIMPAANSSTATARVTLYVTQPEFDEFNNYGTKANLPVDSGDVTGIDKLRIIKFSGQSIDGSGAPSSYTQPGIEINPDDNNIVWNHLLQRWEITFNVTGFGGFFIGNESSSILPMTLLYFNGKALTANSSMLQWRSVSEINTSHFDLQRSYDGQHFTTITKVQAKGTARSEADYNYADLELKAGMYYYRLRMVDRDGKEKYSAVVSLKFEAQNSITLYPVPAKDIVWLNGGAANLIGSRALLMDAQGRILQTVRIQQWPQSIDISALAAGTYLIKLPDHSTLKLIK